MAFVVVLLIVIAWAVSLLVSLRVARRKGWGGVGEARDHRWIGGSVCHRRGHLQDPQVSEVR